MEQISEKKNFPIQQGKKERKKVDVKEKKN